MNRVKLVSSLALLVALTANFVFAGIPQGTRRIPVPQRDGQAETVKHAKVQASRNLRPLEDGPIGGSSSSSDANALAVPTKKEMTPAVKSLLSVNGLSGNIHIGAAQPGGFKTISDMAFLMNIAFFSGNTTFLLDDPSYTEPGVSIGASSGVGPSVGITIRPNTGNTSCLISLADNTGNKGGLVFTDESYVTIEGTAVGEATGSQNLTIQLSAAPLAANGGDSPVRLVNCKNFGVVDSKIIGNSAAAAFSPTTFNTTNGNGSIFIHSTAGDFSSFITVDNCDLYGGHFGIVSRGNFIHNIGDYGLQDDDFTITNNHIHNVARAGIDLWMLTFATIAHNTIRGVVVGSGAGASPDIGYALPANGSADPATPIPGGGSRANLALIHRGGGVIVWGDHIVVDNNLIDSVYNNRVSAGTGSGQTYGVRIVSMNNLDPGPTYGGTESLGGLPTHNVIKNNIITRVHADHAVQANGQVWSAIGIGLDHGRFDTVVYNSVYMSGTGSSTASACMVINGYTETSGNSGLPDWFGDGSTAVAAFSYRVRVEDNILAINRTSGNASNAVLGIQSSGGVVDYRGGNNNVLFTTSGNIMERASKVVFPSVYDFQQYQITAGFPTDAASQSDDPVLNSETDVAFSGLSTADGTGLAFPSVTTDYLGTVRGAPPDIGALEGSGSGLPHDTKPVALTNPGASGAPAGLPFAPVQVTFLNLGGFTETSFPVNVHIVNPDASIQDLPSTVTLAPGAAANVTIPGNWNPGSLGGTAVFTITTALGTDNYLANDTIVVNIPVAAQATVPYTSGFETPGDNAGWFTQNGFGAGTTGGKLGGPHGGTAYMVTNPGPSGNGTVDATVEYLYTPFFDLSATASATISFYQSIETEPSWDRGIMEYSIDTGKTWKRLGVLNDPAGINWYSTAAYNNAAGENGVPADCWDNVTALAIGFPADGSGANPPPGWTSNGDCAGSEIVTGPTGYIIVALTLDGLPPATSPLGKSYVRFRYSYFTDAGTHHDGIAIDDFKLGAAPVFTPANYSGKVYQDMDGNGTFGGGDNPRSGDTVKLTYFGSPIATTTTDVNGDFTFTNGMTTSGDYSYIDTHTGDAITQNPPVTSYLGTGTASSGNNLGYFTGSISGRKYSDINDNGADNSEPGLAGWSIEVRKDSAAGTLAGSAVTAANGSYSIILPPYPKYIVKEIAQPAIARQTAPPGGTYTDSVTGTSGSATAVRTGDSFGNFVLAKVHIEANIDVDGNGVRSGADVNPLPAFVTAAVEFRKNGVLLSTDTIGNALLFIDHGSLDTGTYSAKLVSPVPALFLKTSVVDSFGFTVTNSGTVDSAMYLYFKFSVASGQIFNDLNGNGAKDGGEPGIAGVSVNVSGTGGGTAISDGSGNWSINTIAQGSHTISQIVPAGYTQTFAAGGLTYTGLSGTVFSSNKTGKDFGDFKNACITGVKYRDRNHNGVQDPGEEGLAGWTINLTGQTSTTTDANGNFSFCNVGPSPDTVTLSETPQAGWVQTQPVGNYTIILHSGDSLTGYKFGNFKSSDTTLYRTFTAAQQALAGNAKPVKAWSAKKPTVPNLGNLAAGIMGGAFAAETRVGLAGQLNGGGKEKGYVLGVKQGDVFKTFNAKGTVHTGPNRGLDFNVKGGVILKRQKALPATTKNDVLAADMLALKLNIAASDAGYTGSGFGTLKYNDAGHALNGKTVNEIGAMCDSLMTNWEGVPYSTYTMFDTVVAKINAAFSDGAPSVPYDTGAWHTGSLKMNGLATVYTIPFLIGNPGVVPQTTPPTVAHSLPTTYALQQNYPNPFNPTTTIEFQVPMASIVTIKVYNMLGQEVATLLNHQAYDGAQFDYVDFDASKLASGVYLYRLVAQSVDVNGIQTGQTFTQVKKMMLVK